MKMVKFSCIALFTLLFMSAFLPELSAKHSSRFSFNLNLDPFPRRVEYNYVYPAPTYTVVRPYPAYSERIYYSSPAPAYEEVVVRPYAERVYVPRYTYWGY